MKKLLALFVALICSNPAFAEYGSPSFGPGYGSPYPNYGMNGGFGFNSPWGMNRFGQMGQFGRFSNPFSSMALTGMNPFGQNVKYKSKLPEFQKQMSEFFQQNQKAMQKNLQAFNQSLQNGVAAVKPPTSSGGLSPGLAKALGPQAFQSVNSGDTVNDIVKSIEQMSETQIRIVQQILSQTAAFTVGTRQPIQPVYQAVEPNSRRILRPVETSYLRHSKMHPNHKAALRQQRSALRAASSHFE